ncbi:MAG: hypothetical protein ACP5HQ_04235 [Thermoprotei archaeon]
MSYVVSTLIAVALSLVEFMLSNRFAIKTRLELFYVFTTYLLLTYLYSMPNVPFSDFWKKIFFVTPLFVDLRTQYALVAPFQVHYLTTVIGIGVGAVLDLLYRQVSARSLKAGAIRSTGVVLIIASVFSPYLLSW